MSKKALLRQLIDAIRALTQQVSDRIEVADRLFDEGRFDESREEMEAAGELVKVVKNSQDVVRRISESDVDDPLAIRQLVQEAVANEDLGLQPLMDELAKQDAWWSEQRT